VVRQKARADGSGGNTLCQAPLPDACYNRAVTPYEQFILQIDALTKARAARYAKHLVCHAGCSGCCQHHLSVFPVEAARVKAALAALPDELRARIEQQARTVNEREAQGQPVACPLLVDERCAIYESRPLICRTQGLPLLLEAEDGGHEVDFCPLNFTAPDAVDDLDEQSLVPLDELNFKLALVNLHHCRTQGIPDAQSGQRQRMSDIVLESEI
jgi:uncharacterized protein